MYKYGHKFYCFTFNNNCWDSKHGYVKLNVILPLIYQDFPKFSLRRRTENQRQCAGPSKLFSVRTEGPTLLQ